MVVWLESGVIRCAVFAVCVFNEERKKEEEAKSKKKQNNSLRFRFFIF